jgi:rhodanese-related sulfurtransferase
MKQTITVIIIALFLMSGVGALAYDKDTAKKFEGMFSQMTPELIAKRPCEIDSKQLFEMLRKKEDFVVLDIRTPQEMAIIGITLKNTLKIPMNELFKEENLNKLPKDKKIIVICHTGTRAVAVTTALMVTGFTNALTFKGGTIELAAASGRSIIGTLW